MHPADNRLHPADELQSVRGEIRRLRAREAELRAWLIETRNRQGALWRAEIVERRPRRIDPVQMPLSARADPRSYLAGVRRSVRLAPVPAGSTPPQADRAQRSA